MIKAAEQSVELEEKVKQLQSELNRTKATSEQLRATKDEQIKNASAEVSSLKAQLSTLQSKVPGDAEHGADVVASLRAQLWNMQEELKNVKSRQSQDSRALESARAQLAQKETERTRRSRTAASSGLDQEGEKTSLWVQLAAARGRCQEANQRCLEAEQSLDVMRADLAEKDSELSKFRSVFEAEQSLDIKHADFVEKDSELSKSRSVGQELAMQTPPRKKRTLADEDMLMQETYFTKRPRKDARKGYLRQSVRRWVGSDFEICWEFKQNGFCPRGARCSWRHPARTPVAPHNVRVKEELEDDDL